MGKKSKRGKQKSSSNTHNNREEDPLRPAPGLRVKNDVEEETFDNLRFEDPYVDEFEEYDEDASIVDGGEGGGGEGDDDNGELEVIQSWNPLTGDQVSNYQELEMDPSAYKMYHALTPEWPSLSFDFLRDDLGESRTRFPHCVTAIVGTQAPNPEENTITVMKLSDLGRIHVETEDDILGEEYNPNKNNGNNNDNESDDDEDSDDEIDLDPVLEHFSIHHNGGVNRIRAMPQQSDIVATWSDNGRVNLFNIEPIRTKFSQQQAPSGGSTNTTPTKDMKPFCVHSKHNAEGYAMDWSQGKKQGHLVTGDCNGAIHLWTPRQEGGFEITPSYERNETVAQTDNASVEDLQWSPTEPTVFCSAECGGYIRIFDTRAPNRAMLCHKIHSNSSDVNVLSWNKLVSNLLATGGDDGLLCVWDLRQFSASKDSIDPLARFTTHKTPITSVEWHPTDESMLVASDDVGAYIYDLSVEEDDDANKNNNNTMVEGENNNDVIPPQLLFVHSGSEQFKEVHWHPQISSCLMSTALSGFSVFIPSNL